MTPFTIYLWQLAEEALKEQIVGGKKIETK